VGYYLDAAALAVTGREAEALDLLNRLDFSGVRAGWMRIDRLSQSAARRRSRPGVSKSSKVLSWSRPGIRKRSFASPATSQSAPRGDR
jgi:hypothetical protein